MPETIYKEDEVIVSTEDVYLDAWHLGKSLYMVLKYYQRKAEEDVKEYEGLLKIIYALKDEVHKYTGYLSSY
ncbi:hypothetical protein DRZ78_02895 [Candidatus Aerophobetes bacterium]|uniref:Uncharacterized protein n=1 Tax=Aerophobetes bacterium TaxID=2030807 RepID=A0A662D4R8_UNCAE|nr:MAG: hypothetical protein DRZ78_02895 [Candidatus Aerophobetes bacterium]